MGLDSVAAAGHRTRRETYGASRFVSAAKNTHFARNRMPGDHSLGAMVQGTGLSSMTARRDAPEGFIGMKRVMRLVAPLQILSGVVCPVSIQMVDLRLTSRRGTMECFADQPMHLHAAPLNVDRHIALLPVPEWHQTLSLAWPAGRVQSFQGADSAEAAHLVPLGPRDGLPLFIHRLLQAFHYARRTSVCKPIPRSRASGPWSGSCPGRGRRGSARSRERCRCRGP
ncbi:hypothetical protein LMG26696_03568 [Achromobacter pulmonis]|nr:hypothetical protein LMG26696_03568 [Achromobacter pulmonis]